LETSAEAEERNQNKKSPVEIYLEITPWLSFFVGLFLRLTPGILMVALPLLVLWGRFQANRAVAQPADKYWSEENGRKGRSFFAALGVADHGVCFGNSAARENWLIRYRARTGVVYCAPRLFDELGLLFNSRLAAMDIGVLTLPEFVADTEKTFDSVTACPN